MIILCNYPICFLLLLFLYLPFAILLNLYIISTPPFHPHIPLHLLTHPSIHIWHYCNPNQISVFSFWVLFYLFFLFFFFFASLSFFCFNDLVSLSTKILTFSFSYYSLNFPCFVSSAVIHSYFLIQFWSHQLINLKSYTTTPPLCHSTYSSIHQPISLLINCFPSILQSPFLCFCLLCASCTPMLLQHPPLSLPPLPSIVHVTPQVMELPLVTLQSADDDNEQLCEGGITLSTNDDIVANPMIQEASSLEPQNGRKVPVPTDLPGLQRTGVEGDLDEFGHRKGHRPMFVPEVDEIRIR